MRQSKVPTNAAQPRASPGGTRPSFNTPTSAWTYVTAYTFAQCVDHTRMYNSSNRDVCLCSHGLTHTLYAYGYELQHFVAHAFYRGWKK